VKLETTKLVNWSDLYSVGIAQIDSEHKKLIDLTNELYAARLAGKAEAALGKILDGVAAYTLTHFGNEEALMRKHQYPGFQQHKAEHDKLVARVKQLQEDCRAGTSTVTSEAMKLLQEWLVSHIVSVDKRYTAHLNAAGVR
jgi:hemerythrin-like metal-binding protein